ncbi:MAG: VWA domain-containing protein [Pseudomonadota bacterium]
MFRFSSPYFLLLLLLLGAAVFFRRRGRMNPALAFSGFRTGEVVSASAWARLAPVVQALKAVALGCLILALAGPQKGVREINILTEGINIILAVDVSESMAALDFELDKENVNRLKAVKKVVREFIGGRRGDRIGLVVFGSEAYTGVPLTRDYHTLENALDRLEIGAAGGATAIGDALGVALKRLGDAPGKSKVIILLTDGRCNSGVLSPEAATRLAAEAKVKVYAIGVGGDRPAPFLVDQGFFGRRVVYQHVEMDIKALQEIATQTGGLFFRAEDAKGLGEIYRTIDSLEKNQVKVKTHAEYNDLYPYFLWPGFLLLVLWVILSNTRFLRVP